MGTKKSGSCYKKKNRCSHLIDHYCMHMIKWLYIGCGINNNNGYLTGAGYQGAIDEVYFHIRELTQSDITALANP